MVGIPLLLHRRGKDACVKRMGSNSKGKWLRKLLQVPFSRGCILFSYVMLVWKEWEAIGKVNDLESYCKVPFSRGCLPFSYVSILCWRVPCNNFLSHLPFLLLPILFTQASRERKEGILCWKVPCNNFLSHLPFLLLPFFLNKHHVRERKASSVEGYLAITF